MESEHNIAIKELVATEQLNQILDAIKYEGESTRLYNLRNTIIIALSIILSPIVYLLVSKFLA